MNCNLMHKQEIKNVLKDFFQMLWPTAIMFCTYFLPSLIAIFRFHNSKNSIAVINLFFGWTILGWVICLAWCVSGNVDPTKSRLYVKEIRYDN